MKRPDVDINKWGFNVKSLC